MLDLLLRNLFLNYVIDNKNFNRTLALKAKPYTQKKLGLYWINNFGRAKKLDCALTSMISNIFILKWMKCGILTIKLPRKFSISDNILQIPFLLIVINQLSLLDKSLVI